MSPVWTHFCYTFFLSFFLLFIFPLLFDSISPIPSTITITILLHSKMLWNGINIYGNGENKKLQNASSIILISFCFCAKIMIIEHADFRELLSLIHIDSAFFLSWRMAYMCSDLTFSLFFRVKFHLISSKHRILNTHQVATQWID